MCKFEFERYTLVELDFVDYLNSTFIYVHDWNIRYLSIIVCIGVVLSELMSMKLSPGYIELMIPSILSHLRKRHFTQEY